MAPITNENTYANTGDTETYVKSSRSPASVMVNGICDNSATLNSFPFGLTKFKSFPIINGLVTSASRSRYSTFGVSDNDNNQAKSSTKFCSQVISESCSVSESTFQLPFNFTYSNPYLKHNTLIHFTLLNTHTHLQQQQQKRKME